MKPIEKDRRKLEREALRLIAEGRMTSFEELAAVIAEVRDKYRPLIVAARKEPNETESRKYKLVRDLRTASQVAGDGGTANRQVVGPGESETSSRNQVAV